MIWQDFVFMAGSLLSVLFLAPTLRDASARVPLETSMPSMLIGAAYSMTFFTLDMTFSALGAVAACTMWSLIAALRAPRSPFYGSSYTLSKREQAQLFVADCRHWARHLLGDDRDYLEQFATDGVSVADEFGIEADEQQATRPDHVAAGD